jgi:hypothetical protein
MGYTDLNRLKKIYVLQEYYLLKKEEGVTTKRIWENVSMLYPMHLDTFYAYLNTNARRRLKEHGVDLEELTKYKDNVIKALLSVERPTISARIRDQIARMV